MFHCYYFYTPNKRSFRGYTGVSRLVGWLVGWLLVGWLVGRSVSWSVGLLHFSCPGHISKSIRDTNLKLHRWIDLSGGKCSA